MIALGLARIEEVSQSRLGIRSPFNVTWMGILTGSALVVSALSLLAARLFSLRNIAALTNRLRPVLALLAKIASPLLMAMAWLLELVLTSLIRFFGRAFGDEGQELSPLNGIAEQLQEFQQAAEPVQGAFWFILQLLKWGILILFFVTVLAILAFSISRVKRSRQGGRSVERESVWETESAARGVRDALESRWRRLRDELQARLDRLRGEEYSLVSIRQIYASLVKLATASGLPRHEAETPYEYIARLHRAFPDSREEIQLITNAYVRAHYGERSFQPEYVQRVRDAWLAINTRQEHSDGS